MSNLSPETAQTQASDPNEPWTLCPAKLESFTRALLDYGGGDYVSPAKLKEQITKSRDPKYACDCPLGPKSRFFGLGGKVCQQEVAYVAHPDPK